MTLEKILSNLYKDLDLRIKDFKTLSSVDKKDYLHKIITNLEDIIQTEGIIEERIN